MDMSAYNAGAKDDLYRHNQVARRHWVTISAIKDFIVRGLWSAAHEAFEELDHDTKIILFRAPSKGGLFTTQERNIIKGVAQTEGWNYEGRDHD